MVDKLKILLIILLLSSTSFSQKDTSKLYLKTTQQDSIINVYKDKDANCLSQIDNYNKIREQHNLIINGLEKDIESIKKENKNLRKATTFLGAGFLGVLVSVITLAFVK
jgi:hypothetical protein